MKISKVRVRELTGTMEVDGQFFQERVVMPTKGCSCWHWLWSAHHLDEAVNTPLFLPAQCLLPKYDLLVLSGIASAAVNPSSGLVPSEDQL